jgi:type III secretion system FlhB-like substrate exporter
LKKGVFVVTSNKAVAVKYNDDLPAPFVLAKGKDKLADRLIEIARGNGIQIIEGKDLTEKLFLLDIDSYIPESMYSVMAEILAFVYAIDDKSK